MTTNTRKHAKFLSLLIIIALIFTTAITTVPSSAATKTHLKKSTMTLYLGHTYQQKLLTSSGKTISNSKIKWTTNNKAVATVSSTGKITVKKEGRARISAKYGGKYYRGWVTGKSSIEISKKTINLALNDYKSVDGSLGIVISDRNAYSGEYTVEKISGPDSYEYSYESMWRGEGRFNITANCAGTAKYKIYHIGKPVDYKIITVNVYDKAPVDIDVINKLPSEFTSWHRICKITKIEPFVKYGYSNDYAIQMLYYYEVLKEIKPPYEHAYVNITVVDRNNNKTIARKTKQDLDYADSTNFMYSDYLYVPITKGSKYTIIVEPYK